MRSLIFGLTIGFMLMSVQVTGQGVGINVIGNAADSSAILDVSSTTQGLLIPRMTEQEKNAIASPANGLMVFNTTTGCINIYINALWHEICPNCIPPAAPQTGNNGPLCAGDTLFLTASFIPGASYLWSGPNNFTSSLQNPVIPNAGTAYSGIFSVTPTVNNCQGNPGFTSVSINTTPVSTFSSNPSSPVTNQPCTFSPTVSGAAYQWAFQGGTPSTSTAQNPAVTWTSTGQYNVTLTVTQNGCSSTSTVQVNVQNCFNHGQSQTFNYTGSVQTWTVPSGVCYITVDAMGAQGWSGSYPGGKGGRAQATVAVNAGETIYVYVGQQGQAACNGYSINAFGGGGKGWSWNSGCGGGGGGASDIRIGGTGLNERVVVAAGGGGATDNGSCFGGYGGGLTGGPAGCTGYGSVTGATQSAGGTGGVNGSFGQGANPNPPTTDGWVGGGGGGWYGGACGFSHQSGSGGSSYTGGYGPYITSNTSTTQDYWSGHGQLIISW